MFFVSTLQSWILSGASIGRHFVLGACLGTFVGTTGLVPAALPASDSAAVRPMDFNIPAQPLGSALVAFGATAGLDLYYNAAFAEGRRSVAVIGKLTPAFALQRLLQGSGLVPRMTGSASVILVPSPHEAIVTNVPAAPAGGRYESYFATIQARINDALCRDGAAGQDSSETFLRLWLAASGVIDQVEVLGAAASKRENRFLANFVQGLMIGAPPPDMPQPVTLVVFPPSSLRQDCRSPDAPSGANGRAN
jgi:hypothetical protein